MEQSLTDLFARVEGISTPEDAQEFANVISSVCQFPRLRLNNLWPYVLPFRSWTPIKGWMLD